MGGQVPVISFIVIGRNEGWRLSRCLDSVVAAAKNYEVSEVIYVDSRSTDGSLAVAKGYDEVQVIEITGQFNAAIARNIGAREAEGDVFFFIDADMEIVPQTLRMLYSDEDGLIHGFASGAWEDHFYSSDTDQTLRSVERARPDEDHYDFHCGGLFLITHDLWEKAGGMRNKLRRNQDFDLAVRLTQMGIPLLRKGQILAKHHTTSPRQNLTKMFRRILSGASMYRMVSLRDNAFNPHQWKYFLRSSYTALLLWVMAPAAAIIGTFHPLWLYLLAASARVVLRRQLRPDVFLASTMLMVVNDVLLLIGLLFFFPHNPSLEYRKVT